MRTIETQLRQYHVTKVGGARYIGEPHDHKSGGGLEPLGPIGVYAYDPDSDLHPDSGLASRLQLAGLGWVSSFCLR